MYDLWQLEKEETAVQVQVSAAVAECTPHDLGTARARRGVRPSSKLARPPRRPKVRTALNERICFLPIWSPAANLILEGKQRIEFRRMPPALRTPFAAILYDPAEQAIRAVLKVKTVLRGPAATLVEKAQALEERRGQSRERIMAYLDSAPNPGALIIEKVIRVGPFRLSEIKKLVSGFVVPQKFAYVTRDSILCSLVSDALREIGVR